jgi:hypothetical protein
MYIYTVNRKSDTPNGNGIFSKFLKSCFIIALSENNNNIIPWMKEIRDNTWGRGVYLRCPV